MAWSLLNDKSVMSYIPTDTKCRGDTAFDISALLMNIETAIRDPLSNCF